MWKETIPGWAESIADDWQSLTTEASTIGTKLTEVQVWKWPYIISMYLDYCTKWLMAACNKILFNKSNRRNLKQLVPLAAAQLVTESPAVEFILAKMLQRVLMTTKCTQSCQCYLAMSLVSGCELSSSRTFSRRLIPPSFISRGQYLLAADQKWMGKVCEIFSCAVLFTAQFRQVSKKET